MIFNAGNEDQCTIPSLQILLKETDTLTITSERDFYRFGFGLGISQTRLDEISASDWKPGDKILGIFKVWTRESEPHESTWLVLVRALIEIKEKGIASRIAKKYGECIITSHRLNINYPTSRIWGGGETFVWSLLTAFYGAICKSVQRP